MIIKLIKQVISSFLIDPVIVLPNTDNLKGKVVVITGASRGLGKAIGISLLRENATVVAIARDSKELQTAYSEYKEKAFIIDADVTNEESVENAIKTVLKKYGKIDVLINNAGIFLDEKYLEKVSLQEFELLCNTNVKGIFLMTKAVLPAMKKKKSGYIINIGSKISHNTRVAPKKVLYATSKYALEGFSLSLAREIKEFGIRVTCLMPGTINSFVSFNSKKYLSPYSVGYLISTLIKMDKIDFESIIFKSTEQHNI